MALQIVLLASLMAVATAAPQSLPTAPNYGHSASAYTEDMKPVDADYDSNPEYSFSYEVHDELSGDVKSHQEARHGDVVEGFYTLIEPDGHRRIVEYKADGQSGFNAVVRREPVGTRNVHNNGVQTAGYNVNDYQH
ncbi:larval cuticle protein A2B [Neodiprion lecontei]|uniref:Larval cuticle protein A2B n=1 Tax=Neodiprion lecontei TaxID=441921 RepID=A0A6J0BE78_NEOLC|nr:larval cuticle protein A2B [Neodiprion lecontei]